MRTIFTSFVVDNDSLLTLGYYIDLQMLSEMHTYKQQNWSQFIDL